MESKLCRECGKKFHRDPKQSVASWNAKQCCSRLCVNRAYEQRMRAKREQDRTAKAFKKLTNWKSPLDKWLYKYRPVGV